MKINIIDGGMIFELNKKYNDYGQYAILNDIELINNLYENYINIGCNYLTTCNYCFKPLKLNNWEELTKKSIELMDKFRDRVKIFGSIPPYFDSYKICEINDDFYEFYYKLINIFKNKADYYLIETSVNYDHVIKIIEIIKEIDSTTNIIVSLYPNDTNKINIKNYLNLNIYGLFINCCSFDTMIEFYITNLLNLNFNNKKFGFYCNNIKECKYSNDNNINNLQKYYDYKSIDKEKLNNFIKFLDFNEIFIGGCCGYGIKEMTELIIQLKTIQDYE